MHIHITYFIVRYCYYYYYYYYYYYILYYVLGARGGVVVEALRYKLEGRGFDSRWCH
jgi:hypothetical protein